MASIQFSNIDFAYPGTSADVFTDLTLRLDSRWRTGVVGRNGRGKTTLMKLLARELSPDRGEIESLEQGVYFPATVVDPTRSTFDVVRDAVGPYRQMEQQMQVLLERRDEASMLRYAEHAAEFDRLEGYSIDARLATEFEKLDVGLALQRRPFETLSGGEQTRALIASLFLRANSFALIDEPTDHLDIAGRALLGSYLREKPGFLLASHDRRLLDEVCDRLLVLTRNEITLRRGGYSQWRHEREQRAISEASRKEHLGKEIASLTKAAADRRSGSLQREAEKGPHADKGFIGHRAAKQMKRALNIEHRRQAQIDERKQLLRDFDKEHALRLPPAEASRTGTLLWMDDLSLVRGERTLFSSLTAQVEFGQRVAICGTNGSGKSSLLAMLRGELEPTKGSIRWRSPVRWEYCPQEPHWPSMTIVEFARHKNLPLTRLREVLSALQITAADLERPLVRLSKGQSKKLALALTLVEGADVLLWDEPLNYVDIERREAIEAVILDSDITLLFVEHDRDFVERVATHRIDLGAAVPALQDL